MQIAADEGFYFGIGAFETVAVEQGRPILLEAHYERLARALAFLGISSNDGELRKKVKEVLREPEMKKGRKVLKITVSPENLLVTTRNNVYREEDYSRGFSGEISRVRRNETSPFTYHKTLNYGECIYEKQSSRSRGIQEPVFLNSRGELTEGATTNLFLVKDGKIYTPPTTSGLLPGIMREYVCSQFPVEERVIRPEELGGYEEMFLTNSLLGAMSVRRLGDVCFLQRAVGSQVLRHIFYELYGYPRGNSLP